MRLQCVTGRKMGVMTRKKAGTAGKWRVTDHHKSAELHRKDDRDSSQAAFWSARGKRKRDTALGRSARRVERPV